MSQKGVRRLRDGFNNWDLFDRHLSRSAFFDIADTLRSETAFVLECKSEREYNIRNGWFYSSVGFPQDFSLSNDSPIVKATSEGETLIINPHESQDYAELNQHGIKAFIAAPILIENKFLGILLVTTKSEKPYLKDEPFPLRYGDEVRVPIKLAGEFLSWQLAIENSISERDIGLWQTVIKKIDDPDFAFNKAHYFTQVKKNLDAAIDCVDIVRKLGSEKAMAGYTEIIRFFISYLKQRDNLPLERLEDSHCVLKISHSFLLSYFLYRFIEDLLESKEMLKDYVIHEQLHMLKCIGIAIKFYFYSTKEGGELRQTDFLAFDSQGFDFTKYIEAICHLISEYAHTKLGIERYFDVEKHLEEFISSQTLLYSLKSSYRDHLFHMIDTCLFGFFLLKNKIKKGKTLEELIIEHVKKGGEEVTSTMLMGNWFIASLMHDIGYILEIYNYIPGAIKPLDFAECEDLMHEIDTAVKERVRKFNESVYKKFPWEDIGIDIKSLQSSDKFDHDVVSTLHVLDIIKKELGRKSALNERELVLPFTHKK